MAMSKGVAIGSIAIGCSLLLLTFISVVCGGVAMSKMTRPHAPAPVSVGLWGFYFVIPAAFSIMAGYKKQSSLMAAALGTHILGIILGIFGLWFSAIFWAILSSGYRASFSDLTTVENATRAVTIIYALFIIVSFVGSIYGCVGTCCAPRGPFVLVATDAQPGTAMMMSTTTGQTYPVTYAQQAPPAYGGQPCGQFYGGQLSYDGQDQVVMDTKPSGLNG